MPYNTAPIPPRSEASGNTQLPLSRVKKMISVDDDIHACSNSAAFIITVATEMFIQYLSEQAHSVVRSEKKPRRNIQYRDLAHAVAHHDNLEFLVDIVPKTIPYKEAKKIAAGPGPSKKTNGESFVEAGQTTLDGMNPTTNGTNGFGAYDASLMGDAEEEGDRPNAQLEKASRGARLSTASTISERQNQGQDVEMN